MNIKKAKISSSSTAKATEKEHKGDKMSLTHFWSQLYRKKNGLVTIWFGKNNYQICFCLLYLYQYGK